MKILVPAVCPHCQSKKTARGGFLAKENLSMWKCRNEGCEKTFKIRTLIVAPAP